MTFNNENLVQDIKSVVADAEAILRTTANQTGEGVSEIQATMLARLADAKDRLINVEEAMLKKAKQAAKVTDEYVHENPWQTAIIAGGVGFLIGYLISSRRD
jgi:ElaB/YqjD/DUF883 family membrane-anchored ribosome-binding protein